MSRSHSRLGHRRPPGRRGVALVFAMPFSIAARWAADSRDDRGRLALRGSRSAQSSVSCSVPAVAAWVQRVELPLSHGARHRDRHVRRRPGGVHHREARPRRRDPLVRVVVHALSRDRRRPDRRGAREATAREGLPRRRNGAHVSDAGRSMSARPGLRAAVVDARRRRVGDVEYRLVPPVHAVSRAWSSSTPPGSPSACSRPPATRWPRAGDRSMPSGSPTSVRRRSCGTAPPGARSAPALGWQDLRTVGRVHHRQVRARTGARTQPVRDQGRAGCSNNARPARDPRPVLRDGRHMDRVDAVARRRPCHRPIQCRGHRPDTDRRHGWSRRACCELLGVPMAMLPTIVDSSGVFGEADALPGSPPIAALVGDQQAVLVGQGCVARAWPRSRSAPAACSTSAPVRPRPRSAAAAPTARSRSWHGARRRGAHGASRRSCSRRAPTSSGCATTSVLIDTRGRTATTSPRSAPTPMVSCTSRRCSGSGTPHWDYGARGTLLGLTRGTDPAHSCAPCWKASPTAAPTWSRRPRPTPDCSIPSLRIDGGMSANPTFVQASPMPAASRSRCRPSSRRRRSAPRTLRGWQRGSGTDLDATSTHWRPKVVVEPSGQLNRTEWAEAVSRTTSWIPELSALDF